MKLLRTHQLCCWLTLLLVNVRAAELFVSPVGGHVAPFTDWLTAATNIQSAIDAAGSGDMVTVTNGIYAEGGKVIAGDLTNRVVLDKPITLRSVNGPWFTVISGAGATNGLRAVRCAWVTNGATLQGFTLTAGATRMTGDAITLRSGGGVWCASSNAIVGNCLIVSNTASSSGGGGYQGTFLNSGVIGNWSVSGSGVSFANLINCTVASNYVAGAVFSGRYTNSIIYSNASGNYGGSPVFSYCCTLPVPPGVGNIGGSPQLAADAIHLLSSSPCRGMGTNVVSGVDLDGQTWNNPPSMGCDEWLPQPVISAPLQVQLSGDPVGFRMIAAVFGGQPTTCFWMKDGELIEDNGHYNLSTTTNLVAVGVFPSDQGGYQIVASNAFGVVTSAVTQLRFHYVDLASASPVAPYSSWQTAANNIQDAVDAAAAYGIVLVTNGLYTTGGKVMGGDLTNRVVLDKPIIVHSVNGSATTIIQGAWDPSTNGPLAVRCAWLTNGAVLSGFTLRGGATRAIVSPTTSQMYGGGVWGSSTNATVSDCRVEMNCASYFGGGAFQATLNRCTLTANRAVGSGTPGAGIAGAGSGGGAYFCRLSECMVTGNRADQSDGGGVYASVLRNCALMNNSSYMNGGAAHSGTLVNCTVTGNTSSGYGNSSGYGSAVYSATLINSLVWGNLHRTGNPNTNYASCTLSYCDTYPLPAGAGNISADPQLLGDGYHLSSTSPCRGAGTNPASGSDIDGQSWSNPPSMGCDEWFAAPMMLSQPLVEPGPQGQLQISMLEAAGQLPMTYYWFRDGVALTGAHYSGSDTAQLLINKLGPEDAGSYQLVASNAFGMVTSAVAQVTVRCVSVAGQSPAVPYANWASAATNIQTAIDAASAGDIVLVTNGVYGFGGKVMAGDLTNRIALDKALIVMSVNGSAYTTIEGTSGLGGVNSNVAPNGTNAVRCAWLADGAVLSGLTLRGGGTRANSTFNLGSGGGVWCASQSALVTYCNIQENSAYYQGGGVYGGMLNNCTIVANGAGMVANSQFVTGQGGGTYNCILNNCLIRANQAGGIGASGGGGGAYGGILNNCTVLQNSAGSVFAGGGAYNSLIRNSIVRNNFSLSSGFSSDIYGGSASYSCYGSYQSGSGNLGNITTDPMFLSDGFHLSSASPCRGVGSPAYTSGTDIDGQTWTNPPSMGCDQWLPEPLVLDLKMQTRHWDQFSFKTLIAGIESSPGYWLKDGVSLAESGHYVGADTTGLAVKGLSASDSGNYQLIVSNAFGMATSRVAEVVIHFANAGNPGATAPYTNWATAADTIQDAIDAATPDDVIVVANGIYNRGGKILFAWDVTNRVALDKPLMVVSVNGPFQTAIEGQWDPVSTNGANAVRCALLWSNSSLAGFTLRNGAAGTNGIGGGVAAYYDELVASCVISNNRAFSGGGAAWGSYDNCWFINNSASFYGGGVYAARGLNNCTVVENSAVSTGGGVMFGLPTTNCIVWFNYAPSYPNSPSTMYNSCSPAPSGSGNITNDPQLVDGLHLASTSPCRGAGATVLFNTTDLDGDAWLSPPSMGADEFNAAALVGPLLVAIKSPTNTLANHSLALNGRITGRASRAEWNFGDGIVLTNGSYMTSHSWTNPGDYVVAFTAFNMDNPNGVSATAVIHVDPVLAPTLSGSGFANITNFQFQFGGQLGANYWVEYATNLSPPITWLTLKNLTSTGGVEQVVDTKATNAARFYRVRAQ